MLKFKFSVYIYSVIIQVLGICTPRYNWSFEYIVSIGRERTQQDCWNSVSHVNHCSKQYGTCWQYKSSEMSSLCVETSISAILRCLFLDKDTCDGSGWEKAYVWGTSVKWNPKYLNHWSCLAQVDSIKAVKFLIHEMWLSSNTLFQNVSWDVFEKFKGQTWSTPRQLQALNDIKVVRIDLNPKPYTLHPTP